MKTHPPPARRPYGDRLAPVFSLLFGCFLGLAVLKFGDPPMMEEYVPVPKNGYELVFGAPWPISWSYLMLGGVCLLGLIVGIRRCAAPGWLMVFPIAWLGWQFLASADTIDARITQAVLRHFVACLVCFFLGLFALSRSSRLGLAWLGLGTAFVLMLALGWQQHFGGLEETRRYAFLYLDPKAPDLPPEYLKKLLSDRVFSTMFYPNALAGALLLLLPPTLGVVCRIQSLTRPARGFLAAVLGIGSAGCLYWSGSKGGWLLMLVLATLALLRLRFIERHRVAIITLLLAGGLLGFLVKYAPFFRQGATSVAARFDYWQAAIGIAVRHPLLGSGPGTFGKAYQRVRRPGSEPARLTHNDYLEQASDSGFPGFVTYAAFIVGALVCSAPGFPRTASSRDSPEADRIKAKRSKIRVETEWEYFCVWLGVLGWCLQGLVEFGLYLPALAWPAFACLGWLLGVGNGWTSSHQMGSIQEPDENSFSERPQSESSGPARAGDLRALRVGRHRSQG